MGKKKNRQYEGAFRAETTNTNAVIIEKVEEDTPEDTDVDTVSVDDLTLDDIDEKNYQSTGSFVNDIPVEPTTPNNDSIMFDTNPPSLVEEETPAEEVSGNVTIDELVAQVKEPEEELEDVVVKEEEDGDPVLLSPELPAVSEVTEPEPIDEVVEDDIPEEKSGEFILLINDGKEPNQNKLIEIENIVSVAGLSYDYNVTATGIAYIGPFETEEEAKEVRLEVVRKGLRCTIENKSEVLNDE